jgi:leucyl aminopeptidase
MNFTVSTKSPFSQPTPVVLLLAFQNERLPLPASLRPLRHRLTAKEFDASDRQLYLLPLAGKGGVRAQRLLLAGLGLRREFHPEKLRRVAGLAVKRCRELGFERLTVVPPADLPDALPAIVEATVLANYRFTDFKEERTPNPTQSITFALEPDADLPAARAQIKTAQIIAESTNFTRALANLPPNVLYPATLAERARQLADELHLTCHILNRVALEDGGFGGLLAVGGGSGREPHLIVLEYRGGAADAPPFAVVGKAITFDTGGISIKSADRMDEMKFDKAGGCATLGILRAAALLKLPVNLLGVIAAAENMPSATSYRPGDIITSYRGKDARGVTIEVLNTDAEGRIVLGDALAYARERGAAAIVDLATLTGACKIALGDFAAGLLGNHEALILKLRDAGEATGERCWPLPLWQEYRDLIKSDVADHKNTGGRAGGAISAAAFLERYVGDTAWAHLDICGTAWTTEERPCFAKGATGYGVRLLIEVLRQWQPTEADPPRTTSHSRPRVATDRPS